MFVEPEEKKESVGACNPGIFLNFWRNNGLTVTVLLIGTIRYEAPNCFQGTSMTYCCSQCKKLFITKYTLGNDKKTPELDLKNLYIG